MNLVVDKSIVNSKPYHKDKQLINPVRAKMKKTIKDGV